MSKDWNPTITNTAAGVGIAAVVAHHVGANIPEAPDMEKVVVHAITNDSLRGIIFGAGGGAAVAILTRGSMGEVMGRMFVGGLMAAAVAPWFAGEFLKIPANSTTYPLICVSIGVLGFQIVKAIIDNPAKIPGLGKLFEQMPVGGPQANAGGQVEPPATQPPAQAEWQPTVHREPPALPPQPQPRRTIRVPLS